MVFRASRRRKQVKRRGKMKRGGFIVSIPLLITGAVAAAKVAATGAAMAAGGLAVEKNVEAIDNTVKNKNKPNPIFNYMMKHGKKRAVS